MDFDSYLKDTLTKANEQGVSKEGLKILSDKLIADYNNQLSTQPQSQEQPEQVGFWHGLVQDIARVPIKEAASVSTLAGEALAAGSDITAKGLKLIGAKDASDSVKFFSDKLGQVLDDAEKNGIDYGYFGKVTPIGGETSQRTDLSMPEKILNIGTEGAGTGTQLVSYGFNPSGGFWKQALKLGSLMGIGSGVESLGKGKSPIEAGEDALTTGAATAAGMGLLHMAAAPIAWVGNRLIKSEAGKALGSWIAESVEKMYKYLPEEFTNQTENLSKSFQTSRDLIKDDFNKNLSNEVNRYITAENRPVNPSNTIQNIQNEWSANLTKLYEEKNANIGNALDNAPSIKLNETEKAIKEAELALEKAKGVTPDLETRIKNSPAGSEERRNLMNELRMSEDSSNMPILEQYIRTLRSKLFDISTGALKEVPAQTADTIGHFSSIQSQSAKTNFESGLINQIQNAIFRDLKSELKIKSPDNYALWAKGQEQFKNLKDVIDSNFSSQIKAASDPLKWIDENIIDSKLPLREVEEFMKRVTNPVTKKDLSQMITNRIIQRGRAIGEKLSNDPIEQTKQISKFIDGVLNKEGIENILSKENREGLYNIKAIASNDFDSVLSNAKSLLNNKKEIESLKDTKLTLDRTSKIDELIKNKEWSQIADSIVKSKPEEVDAILANLKPEEKTQIGQQIISNIFKDNENVLSKTAEDKFNFSGVLKSINNIGKDNWDKIFDPELKKAVLDLSGLLENQKNLESIPAKKASAILHAMAAVANLSIGRTYTAAIHGVEAGGAIFKNISKQTEKEIYDLLVKEGRMEPSKILETIKDVVRQGSNIAPAISTGEIDKSDKITEQDISKHNLPQELLGTSELQLKSQLKKVNPPTWFKTLLESRGYNGDSREAWKQFKTQISI